MKHWMRLFGSLKMAVPMLVAIAGVLAWGTIYETRFGTAAVQRFVYQAWWFQLLLAFLATNLAIAALQRYPWKRQHLPFVLAHIGIILILIGGIIGGRFGIDGQLFIPEGEAAQVMDAPGNVLVVRDATGAHELVKPIRFETQAWVHEPRWQFPFVAGDAAVQLMVDRYYPDAVTEETITGEGTRENPAVRVQLQHEDQQDTLWLLAREAERIGVGWGQAHVLLLEPQTESHAQQLLQGSAPDQDSRGTVTLTLPGEAPLDIAVPHSLGQPQRLGRSAYTITFKDYFPDFALSGEGPSSRSEIPNNPAVSFLLEGPEGADAYLLFALHPEFQSMHGFQHQIKAHVTYEHSASLALPPQAIALLWRAEGRLSAVLTGDAGQRQVVERVKLGEAYAHPFLGYTFQVLEAHPRAQVTTQVTNRSNEVRREMVHVRAQRGQESAEAWVAFRETATLTLEGQPLIVEYRPAQRRLPVTIKLSDFRKIDYPGISMAAGFESDVQLTDAERGIILMRKISMNEPLRYRGYSFFQSSFVDGPTQTTILSVRNDPGTPVVYAGFLIVIGGVLSLFVTRNRHSAKARSAEAMSLKYLREGKDT
jgi:cytochrome c biogenesis protein ResB